MRQYNCYIKVTLTNGYVCNTESHTTHVTGIPYSYAFYSGDLKTHTGDDKDVVLTPSNEYITITSDSKSGVAYHYIHSIKIEYR